MILTTESKRESARERGREGEREREREKRYIQGAAEYTYYIDNHKQSHELRLPKTCKTD